MKNGILFIMSLLLLASCNKGGVRNFEGEYSFKISGTIVLSADNEDISVALPAESGQMSIKQIEDDSVMVVMNIMNGDVLITSGFVDDTKLILNNFNRSISQESSVLNGVSSNTYKCNVVVSGEGTMYDDMIVFTLQYNGNGTYKEGLNSEKDVTVVGTDIKMAAFKND